MKKPVYMLLLFVFLSTGGVAYGGPIARTRPFSAGRLDCVDQPVCTQRMSPLSVAEVEEYDFILTASSTDLSTGEVARFTVTVPDSMSNAKAVIKFDNFYGEILWFDMVQASDTTFEYEYKAAGETSGRLEAKAMLLGEIDGEEEMLYSQKVQLYVTPKMDELWGMEAFPRQGVTITTGRIRKISVIGAFDDGYDRLISDSAMGTRYEIVGEEGIVSISPDGVMTGLKKGTTHIRITNGTLSADFRVSVFPSSGKQEEPVGPDEPEEEKPGNPKQEGAASPECE
jgi:hypothetical protein